MQPFLCISRQYNLFLTGYYLYKTHDWYFLFFSYFSGLKPNLTKSEIAGTGVLEEVQVTFCGMPCIDLNNDTLKVLGTNFSCNTKIKEENKIIIL